MSNEVLTQLRTEIAAAAANLKQCDGAYRGFKAFRGNQPGLEFCARQLLQAAALLRQHAEHLAVIAENLHDAYSDGPQQLELNDIGIDGRA
jgi:hypothetical protein